MVVSTGTGRFVTAAFLALGLSSGCAEEVDVPIDAKIQAPRIYPGDDAPVVGFDIIASTPELQAQVCSGALQVWVEVFNTTTATWDHVLHTGVSISCSSEPANVSLVADNSGSQEAVLEITQNSVMQFVDDIIDGGGKMGLTRVSTGSEVLTPLTHEYDVLTDAVDNLFVNDGWTALYDGIRMANGSLQQYVNGSIGDDLCMDGGRRSIVIFTNGRENNSADEMNANYSDGIDTTYEDVLNLTVGDVTTPMYIVGLGDNTDPAFLQELADETNGHYLAIDDAEDLPEAFGLVSGYATEGARICAELTEVCGPTQVRMSYTLDGWATYVGPKYFAIDVPCA